ncbi:hypothetical protein [Paracoccus aminovorans]|uniref:hypothetical protein n=1 Tax=Paracoccus aminovorans TaxID=34004 RepID=UPI0034631E50
MPVAIRRFERDFPGIRVTIKDTAEQNLADLVRGDHVDFAICHAGRDRSVHPSGTASQRSDGGLCRAGPALRPVRNDPLERAWRYAPGLGHCQGQRRLHAADDDPGVGPVTSSAFISMIDIEVPGPSANPGTDPDAQAIGRKPSDRTGVRSACWAACRRRSGF